MTLEPTFFTRDPKSPSLPGQPITMSVIYNVVRSRQLERNYLGNSRDGAWPISALRVMYGWGIPPTEAWPYRYERDGWPPPNEPPGIDDLARQVRINHYYRVTSLEACKFVLEQRRTMVGVSLDITDDWFSAADGRIPFPNRNSQPAGAHHVMLTGYSDRRGGFRFLNSWGVGWGDRGFGSISYALFDKTWSERWAMGLGAPVRAKSDDAVTQAVWAVQEEKRTLELGLLVSHADAYCYRADWLMDIETGWLMVVTGRRREVEPVQGPAAAFGGALRAALSQLDFSGVLATIGSDEGIVRTSPSTDLKRADLANESWRGREAPDITESVRSGGALAPFTLRGNTYDPASRAALSRMVSPYGLNVRETNLSWAPLVASVDPIAESPGHSEPPATAPASPKFRPGSTPSTQRDRRAW